VPGAIKPDYRGYRLMQSAITQAAGGAQTQVIFFDDMVENLQSAKAFGWTTVLISRKHAHEGGLATRALPAGVDLRFGTTHDALRHFVFYYLGGGGR